MSETRRPEAVVFLSPVATKRSVGKTFTKPAEGPLHVKSYDNICFWNLSHAVCNGFAAFASHLTAAAKGGRHIVIRGALAGSEELPPGAIGWTRRLVKNGGAFEDVPRSWLMLDFDGPDTPAECKELVSRVNWLRSQLPERFRGVRCWAQVTASHGISGPDTKPRVRLGFWLSKPLNGATAMSLLRPVAKALALDSSIVRNCVQPIFVAAPTFVGMEDPVKSRTAVLGDLDAPDTVNTDDVEPVVERSAMLAAEVHTGELTQAARDKIDAVKARASLQAPADGTPRHNWITGVAGELMALGAPDDEIAEWAEDQFVELGRDPNPGEIPGILSYLRDKVRLGTLTVADDSYMPPLAEGDPETEAAGEAKAAEVAQAVLAKSRTKAPKSGDHSVSMDEACDAGEVCAFTMNDRMNALNLLRSDGPRHYAMCGPTIYRWNATHYAPFRDEEEFVSHVARRVGMRASVNAATATQVRQTTMRRPGRPGVHMRTGAEPRFIPFHEGHLYLDDLVTDGSTVRLRAVDPEVFNTRAPAVAWRPGAKCPTWHAFLDSVWGPDDSQKKALQLMFGYVLSGNTNQQKCFWLVGATGAGKGVTCDVLASLVGGVDSASIPWTAFAQQFGLSNIFQKTLVVVDEANASEQRGVDQSVVDFIKSVTGEAEVQIDVKYKTPFQGRVPTRFVFTSNDFPNVVDPSGAFARRVQLLQFRNSFTAHKKHDPDLRKKLSQELPGIAQWALEGLREIMLGARLETPPAVQRMMALVEHRQAPEITFANVALQRSPGAEIDAGTLLACWEAWCRRAGWGVRKMPSGPTLIKKLILACHSVGWTDVEPHIDDYGVANLHGAALTDKAREIMLNQRNNPAMPGVEP